MEHVPITVLNFLLIACAKTYLKICAGAEHSPMSSHHYTLDPVIDAKSPHGFFNFLHHGICESIVVLWAI